MEAGAQATGDKKGMDALIPGNDTGAQAILYGFGQDGIAVVVVHNEEIVVAFGRGDDEAAGKVAEDLASERLAGGEDGVCSCGWWLTGCRR